MVFCSVQYVHLPSQETRRQTGKARTGMLGRFRVWTGRRVRCRVVGGWVDLSVRTEYCVLMNLAEGQVGKVKVVLIGFSGRTGGAPGKGQRNHRCE